MPIVTVTDGNPFGQYVRRAPPRGSTPTPWMKSTSTKGLGGFGEGGVTNLTQPGESVSYVDAEIASLVHTWPGLALGGLAAALGYPKVAVGATVAGDATSLVWLKTQILGPVPFYNEFLIANAVTTVVAATAFYFLGRACEKAWGKR